MRSHSGRRSGLTLIEVVVALAISGMVLLAARGLADVVGTAGARVATERRTIDDAATSHRTLHLLFARVQNAEQSSQTFSGDSTSMRFTSWCDAPGGWLEQCQVSLHLVRNGERAGVTVTALSVDATTFSLDLAPAAAFYYLRSADGGGEWTERWEPSLTTPFAIEIRASDGKVFVRIGERG